MITLSTEVQVLQVLGRNANHESLNPRLTGFGKVNFQLLLQKEILRRFLTEAGFALILNPWYLYCVVIALILLSML